MESEDSQSTFNAPKSKKSKKAISLNIRLYSATKSSECAEATFQFQNNSGNDLQYHCEHASSWGLSGKYYYKLNEFKPIPSTIIASQISQLRDLVLAKMNVPSLKELSARKINDLKAENEKIFKESGIDKLPEIQEYLSFVEAKNHVYFNTITQDEFKNISRKDQENLLGSVLKDIGLNVHDIEENEQNQLTLVNSLVPNYTRIHLIPQEWTPLFQASRFSEQLSKVWSFEGRPSTSGEVLEISVTLPSQEGEPKIIISSDSPNPYLLPWKISVYPHSPAVVSSPVLEKLFASQVKPMVEFISYSVKIPQYLSAMFSSISGPMWFEKDIWKNQVWKGIAHELSQEIKNLYHW